MLIRNENYLIWIETKKGNQSVLIYNTVLYNRRAVLYTIHEQYLLYNKSIDKIQ